MFDNPTPAVNGTPEQVEIQTTDLITYDPSLLAGSASKKLLISRYMPPAASSDHQAQVRLITAAETMPLRLAILRPGRPIDSARFPGDDAPGTHHFGAFRNGDLVGIASLFTNEVPEHAGVAALQVRGMATAPEVRGLGFGRALVRACIDFTRQRKVILLWCNARTSAAGFYQKLGFTTVGPEFEIPDVGPHFRMLLHIM